MRAIQIALVSIALCVVGASSASANTTKLDRVYGGSNGTVVFIHGHHNCVGGNGADSRCTASASAYWANSTEDGGDGHVLLDEATTKLGTGYYEAFTIRLDEVNQGYWYAANDVAYCLRDLKNGTNTTGCNPNLYQRTSFRVVAHSEGGAILDRIFSTGWWSDLTGSGGAIIGSPISNQGALAGARSASALYGVDGAGNICTSFVSWILGETLMDTGTASLTRGTVIGEANNGMAGKSPRWFLKVTTTGGNCSCNNNGGISVAWLCGDSVDEHANDIELSAAANCVGYSSSDDTDGLVWQYDSDPTNNPGGSNGGKYRSQWTGYYWHWISSFANHSHGRNDAYVSEYGMQNSEGCFYISPGTCIGEYGI